MRRESVPALGFIAIAAMAIMVACGPHSTPATVRIAYQPIVFGVPVFWGMDSKAFESRGIQITATSFTSANDMLNALVANQVDLIPSAPLVPVVALEARYPGRLRIMAHSIMRAGKPFDRIIVDADSKVQSVSDLKGKRLALIPGTTASNVVKAYLKSQGVDPGSVSLVQLAPTSQLPALQSRAVDALYAYEPTVTIALSQRDRFRPLTGSLYTTLLDPCPLVVTVVSREFEAKNPELVRRLAESLAVVYDSIDSSPLKVSQSMARHLKIDPQIAKDVHLQSMTRPEQIDLDNLQRFIDVLRSIGEISEPVSAESLVKGRR